MSRFLEANGLKLHLLEKGDPQNPLMLFLHGFPDFAWGWKAQMDHFSKDYYCVAYDQRGYNLTDQPKKIRDYHLDHLAKDAAEMIKVLGYDKAIIVGHDWGGVLGYHLAQRYPERVEKLVVINAPLAIVWKNFVIRRPAQFLKSLYVFFFQLPWIPEFLLSMGNYWIMRKGMRLGSNKGTYNDETLDGYLARWKQSSLQGMLHWYRNLFRTHYVFPSSNVKTLLVWGKKDKFLISSITEANQKLFPNTTLKIIDEAGHWAHHEFPQKVNEMIEVFL